MSSISCTEFNVTLEQTVEARLPVDTGDLRAHAAECATCRTAWLDALLLEGAVAQWRQNGKRILPSVDLTDLVLFRNSATRAATVSVATIPFTAQIVDSDPVGSSDHQTDRTVRAAAADSTPRRAFVVRRRMVGVAAMVLTVAVCVAIFGGRLRQRKDEFAVAPRPEVEHVKQPSGPKPMLPKIVSTVTSPTKRDRVRPADPVSDSPVETIVQGAELAYLDLANEAAHAVAGATTLVPRPGSAKAPPRSGDESDRWVDDVGRQFEPVSKSLGQAFQFLLEAVPADKAPAT